jgi:hypothetical protein
MEQTIDDTPPREPQMGLTFEKVWAMFQEIARESRETDRQFKETDRRFKETDRKFKETDRKIGELGNKFGSVVEHMMIPNIKEKFNLLGYEFGKVSTNVIIETKEEGTVAEIDIFLENGDCALAVEVKSQPRTEDINLHCERMEKLRRYSDRRGDRRKLYAAAAGAVITENVRACALKKGLYLIEQSGDTVRIIEPSGAVRAW